MNKLDRICKWLYDNNKNMTNLKLQKLLYFIQAYMLVAYNREAFDEEIVAWQYGPVIVEVYEKLKKDKDYYRKIETPIVITDTHLNETLNIINRKLGFMDAFKLVDLTHSYSTWLTAWNLYGWNGPISKQNIKNFHEMHIKECNGEIF